MNYATATKEYGDIFNIEVESKKYDSETDKGKVIEQVPASGTDIERPENSTEKITIRVVISLGKNTVTMPDLSGMTYQDAYIALVKLGSPPENISVKEKFSATVEPGLVVETSPIAKTANINVESSVVIYTNNRQPESSAPEVSSPAARVFTACVLTTFIFSPVLRAEPQAQILKQATSLNKLFVFGPRILMECLWPDILCNHSVRRLLKCTGNL